MKRKFSEEEIQYIKDNYPSKGAKFCAKFSERSKDCIIQKAMQLGVKRDYYRVPINIGQFLNIQTPEIAYILGLLWADGTLNKTSNNIALEINLLDMKNIEGTFDKIGEFSKYYRKQRGNDKETGSIICCQKDLYSFLKENDYLIKSFCSPSKILNNIPNNLKHYFWRGFNDGDGHIRVDPKGRYLVVIAGSYGQDWLDIELLLNGLNIKFTKRQTKKINPKTQKINQSSMILISGKENFNKYLEYIYKNRNEDGLGLDRKYNKFLLGLKQIAFFKSTSCRGSIGIEVFDLKGNFVGRYKSIVETAKSLNLSAGCIYAFFKENWKYYKDYTFKKIANKSFNE